MHKLMMPWEHAGCEYNTEDKVTEKDGEINVMMRMLEGLGASKTFDSHVDAGLRKEAGRKEAVARMRRKSMR